MTDPEFRDHKGVRIGVGDKVRYGFNNGSDSPWNRDREGIVIALVDRSVHEVTPYVHVVGMKNGREDTWGTTADKLEVIEAAQYVAPTTPGLHRIKITPLQLVKIMNANEEKLRDRLTTYDYDDTKLDLAALNSFLWEVLTRYEPVFDTTQSTLYTEEASTPDPEEAERHAVLQRFANDLVAVQGGFLQAVQALAAKPLVERYGRVEARTDSHRSGSGGSTEGESADLVGRKLRRVLPRRNRTSQLGQPH